MSDTASYWVFGYFSCLQELQILVTILNVNLERMLQLLQCSLIFATWNFFNVFSPCFYILHNDIWIHFYWFGHIWPGLQGRGHIQNATWACKCSQDWAWTSWWSWNSHSGIRVYLLDHFTGRTVTSFLFL